MPRSPVDEAAAALRREFGGESPTQALRRILAMLTAATATRPTAAEALKSMLAHEQLATFVLDAKTRLHGEMPPSCHLADAAGLLEAYRTAFLGSWEGEGDREYYLATHAPDVLDEWCKVVAWSLQATPAVLYRDEHLRGPSGYESAGGERVRRLEALLTRRFEAGEVALVLTRLDVAPWPASTAAAEVTATAALGDDDDDDDDEAAGDDDEAEARATEAEAGDVVGDVLAPGVARRRASKAAALLSGFGAWRVAAVRVSLHPDYYAHRPLETWYDFPPFSQFDPVAATDPSYVPETARALAAVEFDDDDTEPEEEPEPEPPTKGKKGGKK